jgi:hypothetical protein
MRTLTTLYRIAYGRIMLAEDNDYTCICHMINTMVFDKLITDDEAYRLRKDIIANRPTEWKHVEIAAHKSYDWDSMYWFPLGELKYRKQFLHKMINYSKPWYIKLYYLWKGQLK